MEKIRIRKMTSGDFAFAVGLTDTMNWDLSEKDFRFMMALEPNGCFVASYGTAQVGLATATHFDRLGWIGNVIVDDAYRSKGIGTLLVKHATDYLLRRSVATVGLYSYMDTVPFYEKFGFKPGVKFIRLVGQGANSSVDARVSAKMTQRDLPDVIYFDRMCMGWNRERLLRRIFAGSRDLCYVIREGRELVGFVMADWYRQEIGPLVSRRDCDEEALDLLKAVLSRLPSVKLRIGVSEKRPKIVDAIQNMGFKEEFKVVRMHLGERLEDTGCLLAMESLERG